MAQVRSCPFLPLDGALRREYTTVVIHRIGKNQGCPTRRLYAWGVVSCPHDRPDQRIKAGNDEFKAPHVNPSRGVPNSFPRSASGLPALHRICILPSLRSVAHSASGGKKQSQIPHLSPLVTDGAPAITTQQPSDFGNSRRNSGRVSAWLPSNSLRRFSPVLKL
jgi:hypothetical protein